MGISQTVSEIFLTADGIGMHPSSPAELLAILP